MDSSQAFPASMTYRACLPTPRSFRYPLFSSSHAGLCMCVHRLMKPSYTRTLHPCIHPSIAIAKLCVDVLARRYSGACCRHMRSTILRSPSSDVYACMYTCICIYMHVCIYMCVWNGRCPDAYRLCGWRWCARLRPGRTAGTRPEEGMCVYIACVCM